MTISNSANTTSWIPRSNSTLDHPHMTDEFACVYEMTANRNTGQIAAVALDRVGDVRWGTRVLDIAAGAGALSVPAALSGASVLAVDHAPGMVKLLTKQLAPFPSCEARLMDGQHLALEDETFDVTFSLLGVSIFPDWRRGLAEQFRVTRSGGKACVATWRTPPGGGPFMIMMQALHSVFPNSGPPAAPEGFLALADPDRLAHEMKQANMSSVMVEEFETVWEGPSGKAYLDALKGFHRYIGAYAQLDDAQRRSVDAAVLDIVDGLASGTKVVLRATAVLAVGTK